MGVVCVFSISRGFLLAGARVEEAAGRLPAALVLVVVVDEGRGRSSMSALAAPSVGGAFSPELLLPMMLAPVGVQKAATQRKPKVASWGLKRLAWAILEIRPRARVVNDNL